MLLFLFLIFVCCAVKCDYVSNIYVIEMPEENVAKATTPFKVYWNVPTKQCKSKKVIFDNLEKFGIIQNHNDSFEGEQITIMYDPGVFPAIFKSESGKYKYRNGGVPQEGNLEMHLTEFKENLSKSIPDPNFSGVGIIDFESWRPIFRQLFGSLTPYVTLSMDIERRRHFWWPTSWQKTEATKRFEDAARVFMQTTLSVAKQMRPKASWGYYAFPYCFNMGAHNMTENCSNNVKGENDRIYWLWSESTALLPSVYSSSNLTTFQLKALVRGRVTEANRVKKPGTLVLPYFWFRYRDAGFMSEEDVTAVFEVLYTTKASGIIIWGSSNDVNRVNKCKQLYDYVETVLGPIVKKYVQKINKVNDEQALLDPHVENSDNILASPSNLSTTTISALHENVSNSVEQEELLNVTKNDTLSIEFSTTEKTESTLNNENTYSEVETSTDDTSNVMNNSDELIKVAITMRRPINTSTDFNYNNSWNFTEMPTGDSNYITEDLMKLAINSDYFMNASVNIVDNDTVIWQTFRNISKDTREKLIDNDKKDIVITLNINIIYPEMVSVNVNDVEITVEDANIYSLDEKTTLSSALTDSTISQDIEN